MMPIKRKIRKKKISFQNSFGKLNGTIAWQLWKKQYLAEVEKNEK